MEPSSQRISLDRRHPSWSCRWKLELCLSQGSSQHPCYTAKLGLVSQKRKVVHVPVFLALQRCVGLLPSCEGAR